MSELSERKVWTWKKETGQTETNQGSTGREEKEENESRNERRKSGGITKEKQSRIDGLKARRCFSFPFMSSPSTPEHTHTRIHIQGCRMKIFGSQKSNFNCGGWSLTSADERRRKLETRQAEFR